MSANEETIRAWLAAGDRGDVEAFDRYLHPEVAVHAPRGLSTAGIDAERSVWADAKRAIPDLRHEVQDVISDGERVVVRAIVTGTMTGDFAGIRATGRPFQIDQVVIAYFRDGRIVEAWEIADTGSLLQQMEG